MNEKKKFRKHFPTVNRKCTCVGDGIMRSHIGRYQKKEPDIIYSLFITNYRTAMLYLKWTACLVHEYMGYCEYNARLNSGLRTSHRARDKRWYCASTLVRVNFTKVYSLLSLYICICVCVSAGSCARYVFQVAVAHVRTLKHAGLQIGSVRSRVRLPNKDCLPSAVLSNRS